MILRPVSPASPTGPPITKGPEGFRITLVAEVSRLERSRIGVTTSSSRSAFKVANSYSEACWLETTTVSMETGVSPS